MTIFCILFYAVAILLVGSAAVADAQNAESPQVVVQLESGELASAYGAPPDLSHGHLDFNKVLCALTF